MPDRKAQWTKTAEDALVGKRVKSVRYLTSAEMRSLGWNVSVLVLEFDDGTLVFPSCDDEGNEGGALFGQGPDNEELVFPVIRGSFADPAPVLPPPLTPPKYEGPFEDRHKKMLKRVVRGEVLHGSCGRTLGELRDLGYLSKMKKEYPDPTKGEAIWKVTLSKKGKEAG